MHIAICEDNLMDAQRLTSMIDMAHTYEVYSSGQKLISEMEELSAHFDLYLLDIFLDDNMDGVRLAHKIRDIDSEALICFVSASDDFYREAYDLYAFQYLVKPVGRQDFEKMLERAAHTIRRNRERVVTFERYGKPYAIPYGDILYIASQGHRLLYKCKGGVKYQSNGKLQDVAEKLDPEVFARCHQSFLVNLYNVDDLKQNMFLCEGEEIPISRPYYKDVKKQYRKALFDSFD
ncbi:LytTR family DNA-binding domain-containing protein [Anaerovorax odorimutans]|uniref:Stage 0 sporulation protein A homolog n=1 Tax=Anaerovorax odorimutans TaxID=109327 RepID=A0ABT1RQY8_9FIRM|nr:LytTR family DNA-binding domain-containing protein [Anaerovorax odorimutans]MCQ4637609.1 LytTR family DNA-binding domain-containing protein [Anaerovorax odorimutans]